eukprot:gene4029-8939_t
MPKQNTQLLSQFLSESTGQILRRDITGVSAKQQRKLAKAVKRARHFGLLPYLHKPEKFTGQNWRGEKGWAAARN